MSASRRPAGTGRAGQILINTWVLLLVLLVLGPLLAPGYVLSYDMVWVPDLSVTRPDLWGLGSALPRAVPSDAVVAVLGTVISQQLLQKALLVGALVVAGTGGAALTRGLGLPARLAAATVMVWNPLVAERLGLGHWPLLLAYAATPWLVLAVRDRRFALSTLLLAVTALSPASGVMGLVIALVVGRITDAWRWCLLALAVNAPWLVASLLSPAGLSSDSAGVTVFAARGTGSTPVWLEVATLGGVWNSDVAPPSRDTAVATIVSLVFVACAVAGAVRMWRAERREVTPLVVLWVLGFATALAGAVAPSLVRVLVDAVPGAGMMRDGSRWVLLMVPASVLGLAGFVEALTVRPATRAVGWLVAVVLPVAVVPDLGWGLGGNLRAVEYPRDWNVVASVLGERDEPGDLVSVPFSAFRAPAWNDHRPVLDPAGRYFARVTVTDDTLTVGEIDVVGEDPRAARIGRSVRAGDWGDVAEAGVGFVILDTSAPGGSEAAEQVGALPLVIESGSLQLREVPGAASRSTGRARTSAVVAGWCAAGTTLVAAVIQLGRRRVRPDRARR